MQGHTVFKYCHSPIHIPTFSHELPMMGISQASGKNIWIIWSWSVFEVDIFVSFWNVIILKSFLGVINSSWRVLDCVYGQSLQNFDLSRIYFILFIILSTKVNNNNTTITLSLTRLETIGCFVFLINNGKMV
jgi:hypothetical protein